MSWMGREAHLECQESSKPTCRPGSSREDHPDVQEAHTEVWKGSGGPHKSTGGVRSHTRRVRWTTRRSGRGWVAHPEIQKGLRGHP